MLEDSTQVSFEQWWVSPSSTQGPIWAHVHPNSTFFPWSMGLFSSTLMLSQPSLLWTPKSLSSLDPSFVLVVSPLSEVLLPTQASTTHLRLSFLALTARPPSVKPPFHMLSAQRCPRGWSSTSPRGLGHVQGLPPASDECKVCYEDGTVMCWGRLQPASATTQPRDT